jgi:hypothetical protein
MATRPKVHQVEVQRAIAKIAERRAQIDDSTRESLPDSPDADPREVLDYLRTHSTRAVPLWVLQAEVCDGLILNNWLWWEDRRRELQLLRAGVERGLYLAQLGAQIGVGKQGVRDRIDRLEALLRYDRPDEKIMRRERRTARGAIEDQSVEAAWIESHREELLELMADLAAQADRFELHEAERDWLDELAADAGDRTITPATMVILGLSAAELRTSRAVLALPPGRPYSVHALLAAADNLRAEFAALGTRR